MGRSLSVISGHRAVVLGPRLRAGEERKTPLVLLGGTAQWLDSWTGHLSALARARTVLLYETAGQGGGLSRVETAGQGGGLTSLTRDLSQLDVADATLPRHAADFARVLEASGLARDGQPVDVCAFSFGARVAMAAAAMPMAPSIRRFCVTGVAADRGPYGRLALASWRASLAAGDLPGFVWRLILDTHSPSYLSAHEESVGEWVRAVVAANSCEGLRAVVEQTHTEDPNDSTHPVSMARAIRTAGTVGRGLLIAGNEDRLSPPGSGAALADAAGFAFTELQRTGHAVPIEQAPTWRRTVLEFLDGDSESD